jgi:hypothetical protein
MTDKQTINRREFLRKVTSTVGGSVGLVAASSVVASTQVIDVPKIVDETPAPASKGYQRTEHVNTYYQLADF